MFYKTLVLCLAFLVLIPENGFAREYQFIPARCDEQVSVEHKIGGSLSICTFPPKHQAPNSEDIQAVIKHIQSLKLN
ncbi:uncharacterized protein LOC108093409 [Drosophila ficusphila]|uniref:uncharacterized protein LOC108093409 n=1 Tax=Drosophila ficusphila TaxID=30025 RepID=UPI0007E608EC|nr:uncharacterized protein LOC108093409 [Drosophila ficusphila]